jgi:sterol desaturase/sphingolipid hydroxylase (fatty acid hydroxylase superfamily)
VECFAVLDAWAFLVDWCSGHIVSPLLTAVRLHATAGDAREIAEALLIGALQIAIIGLVLRPLESWAPAEPWGDRGLTRIDRKYTLLMLLGLNPLFAFLVIAPLVSALGFGGGEAGGGDTSGLRLWVPWFNGHPLLLFVVYYVLYDLTYYWMHRVQHAIPWWWALHSMHHSQRQMSCWTNDRGSYLDGGLQSIVLACVGVLTGVDAAEFAWLMLLSELVQNLSHTNVRLGFGRVLEKVFVDPKFHRLHHMRVDPQRPELHRCNFGQVLSIWDVLFGTALYGEPPRQTGVGDPTVDADNARGLVAMQIGALKRFWGAVRRIDGWKPGEVAFGPDGRPIRVDQLDLHAFEETRISVEADIGARNVETAMSNS